MVKKSSEKSPTMTKKLERRTLWNFLTSFLSQNIKKLKGGPIGKKGFFRKSPTMPRKTGRGPFSVAWYCMLQEKKEKPLWFSSLGQMVQFNTMKFRKTFKNYFGQFVWIEQKPLV